MNDKTKQKFKKLLLEIICCAILWLLFTGVLQAMGVSITNNIALEQMHNTDAGFIANSTLNANALQTYVNDIAIIWVVTIVIRVVLMFIKTALRKKKEENN